VKTDLVQGAIKPYNFRELFVLDLANNHEGNRDHGLKIISEVGAVVRKYGVKGALKFQFRDLDSLIHPSHREGSQNKHIPRFLKNALSAADFRQMAQAVRECGMITMATPFDEASVDMAEELDIEILKIASCSATDWPLLEKVAKHNRPVVVSTGGLTLADIDNVVTFFDHRGVDFAIMHCVSIYPTPSEHLQLNQIGTIKRRYPDKVVGFSTHEDPTDTDPVIAAVALGAEMLERHVGIEAEGVTLNKYSSTPDMLDRWIAASLKAKALCGSVARPPATQVETEALLSLRRGVYAAKSLKSGSTLTREDVYFAMPALDGQLTSGDWKQSVVLSADTEKNGPLNLDQLQFTENQEDTKLIRAVHEIKAMLHEARIALPIDFALEFSHHAGKSEFNKVGAVLIDCVNRDYCKKLVVQLPGQYHPSHCHKKKEETFQVLSGVMEILIGGRSYKLTPGDMMVVPRGVWHSFWTESGVIFEEISTAHHNDDSFYQDKSIDSMPREKRKTRVSQWGRYQWR
jgi:sialic acid synthase SpsE/quercetin dioxygenase-like cupin family protein